MHATERLLTRMARNQRILQGCGTVNEQEQLRRDATVPLVGLAFLAGLICGGGSAPLQALQLPLLRGTLRALYSIGEAGTDIFE